MQSYLRLPVLAGALLLAGTAASAVTLDEVAPTNDALYTDTVTLTLSAGGSVIGGAGNGIAVGPALGVPATGLFFTGVSSEADDAVTDASFNILDDGNTFLTSAGFEDWEIALGRLDFLFTTGPDGSAASDFGSPVLVSLTGPAIGEDLVAGISDIPSGEVRQLDNVVLAVNSTATPAPSAIPAPPTLPLLFTALGSFGVFGRLRRRS